jgi:osmoprotectant transport system substrate-binding protein
MRGHRRLVLGAALLALAIVAAACGSGGDEDNAGSSGASGSTAPKGSIVVGVSGAFAENQLVAEMYAQVLEHAGYTVERQLDLESRDVSDTALESGDIDLKPEYLGYELPTLDPNADTSGTSDEVAARLATAAQAKGLVTYGFSPANSTNAFVVTSDFASQNNVATISDLAPIAGDLTLGGPPDCPKRDFCIPGLKKVYGVEFREFKPLDFGGPQTVAALKAGAIDVGLLFSLDPTIGQEDWVVLQDDKNLQVAGNFVPLVRKDVDSPELKQLLDSVTTKLTNENMIDMVGQVVVDKKDVAEVASAFLADQGLM